MVEGPCASFPKALCACGPRETEIANSCSWGPVHPELGCDGACTCTVLNVSPIKLDCDDKWLQMVRYPPVVGRLARRSKRLEWYACFKILQDDRHQISDTVLKGSDVWG